jgi:hypothetical protein
MVRTEDSSLALGLGRKNCYCSNFDFGAYWPTANGLVGRGIAVLALLFPV